MSKPNTSGMRFVADAILSHSELYNQSLWGEARYATSVAGTGTSCGTPACIAGFTVQFLGTKEGYEKYEKPSQDTIGLYALELLGLSMEWYYPLFGAWPEHWLFNEMELRPWMKKPTEGYVINPSAKDAHSVLHRMADQFDEEFGSNENIHAEQTQETLHEQA